MRRILVAILFTLTACSPGVGSDEGQPGPPAGPPEAASPGAGSAQAPEAASPGEGSAQAPEAASPGADSAQAPEAAAPGVGHGARPPTRRATACGPGSVITGAGVGGLRVGSTVAEVARVCEVVDDYVGPGAEGMMERYIVVDFDTARVRAIVVDDRVWRVHVMSDAFRTADSIGVGTPLSRMLQVPGISGAEGEGRLFVFSPERCGLSFRLSHIPRGGEHRGAWTREALRTLPPGTVVDEVLSFGCGGAEG